jgi:hypothetical protein
MFHKPLEYWFVLFGMVLYAATRDAENQPLAKRYGKVLASAFLAVGLAPELAPYLRGSETIATVAIMAVGILVLDVGVALLQDRAFIKSLIRQKLGGKNDEPNP